MLEHVKMVNTCKERDQGKNEWCAVVCISLCPLCRLLHGLNVVVAAAVLPYARETVLDPSLKPSANKPFWKGPKRSGSCLMRFSPTKSSNLSLFLRLEMNFVHCFRIGVDPLWILTSKELLLAFFALLP